MIPTIEQARAWYSETDPVHGFDHIVRVYHLARYIARVEAADLRIVSAAALLHDIGGEQPTQDHQDDLSLRANFTKQSPSQNEQIGEAAKSTEPSQGSNPPQTTRVENPGDESEKPLGQTRSAHQFIATDFAGKFLRQADWNDDDIQAVQHCIRAHRYRDPSEQPQTLEAQVLFDADKLDAIGAVGVARAIAYAVKAGALPFAIPSETFLRGGNTEPGEIHSAYHEYLYKLRNIHGRLYTKTGRALGEQRRQLMANFFEKLEAESVFGSVDQG